MPRMPGEREVTMTDDLRQNQEEERIGVYVCHCGSNIAGMVDVDEVARLGRRAT